MLLDQIWYFQLLDKVSEKLLEIQDQQIKSKQDRKLPDFDWNDKESFLSSDSETGSNSDSDRIHMDFQNNTQTKLLLLLVIYFVSW